jgi:TonB family protein
VRLLPEIEPWHHAFLRNLGDLFRSGGSSQPAISSTPGEYWADVFVHQPLPWARFAQSGGYHVLALGMIYAVSLMPSKPAPPKSAYHFDRSQVLYFSPSEYLPPISTGERTPASARKADPELAKQPILSVPREANNREQTIVTPPQIELPNSVATPNIVSWTDHTVPVPIEATQRQPLTMASLNGPVVAPPSQDPTRNSAAPTLAAQAVAPPPEASVAQRSMQALGTQVIAPAPTVSIDSRRVGNLNVASATVIAPAPALTVPAQRTAYGLSSGTAVVPPPPSIEPGAGQKASSGGRSAPSVANAGVIPPPPSGANTSDDGRRLIALGIHPAAVPPPDVQGNRLGQFSASPEGKPGATGTPGSKNATTNSGEKGQGAGPGADTGNTVHSLAGIPAGIQVGAAPSSAAVSGAKQDPTQRNNSRLIASAAPPPSLPHSPATPANELEHKVFGDRPFYSMTLNLPNLNSAGGSWIMRFAELNESRNEAQISAPQPIHKVDPAYPLELMRQNVAGTVAVRAVIRADGTVADVRVVRSVDERLDRYACEALARWQFSPATREGSPVDLAVLVMIPFKPVRPRANF